MNTLTYDIQFDTSSWTRRWSCSRCGASEDGYSSLHSAEVAAQAHAETHPRRTAW